MTNFEYWCLLISSLSLIIQAIATFLPQRFKSTITISTIAGESRALPSHDREVSDE
jgi:hypothetical protein